MKTITLAVFFVIAAAAVFVPTAPDPPAVPAPVIVASGGDPAPLCPEFPECGGN